MATSFKSKLNSYSQLNTIPAIAGILFSVAAAVQFLGASISLGMPAYSFDPSHAMMLSLAMLVVAFASSDTRDFQYYDTWEQGTVGLAVVLLIGMEYITVISDFITSNEPVTAYVAFIVSMIAWGILSR